MYRIGVDVGGTFTDVSVYEEDTRQIAMGKSLSTAPDPTGGLLGGLEVAATQLEMDLDDLLANANVVMYGTTVATNAVLTGKTGTVGLLCTAGFRDILWFREGGKDDPFDWALDYPPPYVPRRLIRGVEERIDAEGGIVKDLDEDDVRAAVEHFRDEGLSAVAVAYLWSFMNPTHELRTEEIVKEVWPEAECVLSHRVNPAPREYRRTIATAIDASLRETVGPHLTAVDKMLAGSGFAGDLLVVSSEGGVMPLQDLIERPILSVGSGPTMAPVAARHAVAAAGTERRNLLVGDMGGTSFDLSLVRDGRVRFSRETKVGPDLLGIARVDIQSIGAGGGSIIWVDEGGMLHVGPESAGSDPGPACYGRAGANARPTVTDADLVLGYLNPEGALAGGLKIDVGAAQEALAPVADALGTSIEDAALAAYATVNQAMVNEIEAMTTREGVDPSETLFVAGGGACGLHAVSIAGELGMREVLLPRYGGILSSFGALSSDVSQEFSVGRYMRSDDFDHDEIKPLIGELMDEAREFLGRSGGDPDLWRFDGTCEARYVGQVWELDLPMPSLDLDPAGVEHLTQAFHQLHEQVYGIAREDQAVEFLLWRVRATASRPEIKLDPIDHEPGEPVRREIYLGEGEWTDVDAWRGASLQPGLEVQGPTVVEERATTIMVPPGWRLVRSAVGDYRVTRDE